MNNGAFFSSLRINILTPSLLFHSFLWVLYFQRVPNYFLSQQPSLSACVSVDVKVRPVLRNSGKFSGPFGTFRLKLFMLKRVPLRAAREREGCSMFLLTPLERT